MEIGIWIQAVKNLRSGHHAFVVRVYSQTVCTARERGKLDDIFFSLATLGFRVHICIEVMEFGFGQIYCKVASSKTSCLEAHVGFLKLLMQGIFDPYVL